MLQPSNNYYLTINDCVKSDANFIKFHPKFNFASEDKMVEFLVNDAKKAKDYILYDIVINDQLAGMAGIEQSINVHPFLIKPVFRKKEHVAEIWKQLTALLKKNFIMSVYETNSPAIAFYERNAGKLIKTQITNNQNILVYAFDQGSL